MPHPFPGKLRRLLSIETLEARTVLASVAPGLLSSNSPAIVGSALAAPTISLAGETSVLQNDIYQLQVTLQSSLANPLTVEIDWGDGRRDQFSDSRTMYFHTYAAVGLHVVSASLLNTNKQTIASSTIRIEVLAAKDELVDSRIQTGLQAELFSNPDRTGTPALTRIDPTVDFDFGSGGPDPRTTLGDSFSARWTGTLIPPSSVSIDCL